MTTALALPLAAPVAAFGVSSASATDAAKADPCDVESRRKEGVFLAAYALAGLREHPAVEDQGGRDFLIDGKSRWVEHDRPYNYGSDDLHGHFGFLITTWLSPGTHHFTARK